MSVKALFFDVFSTLVDWRSGVARGRGDPRQRGHDFDGSAFADAWRGEYQPAMEEVRAGRIPFCKLDALHRRNLERILPRFGVTGLGEGNLHALTLAWHRLDAWADVPPGLERLRQKFLITPVSNGNISLRVALARRNGLCWDTILGAEVAGHYKPKLHVYRAAFAAFDLAPGNCMMVAAHSWDLAAAAAYGLRTAHVARPDEKGPGQGEMAPSVSVDIASKNLVDLADQLVA